VSWIPVFYGTVAAYPYVVVRIRCDSCRRQGAYRLARIAAAFGAEADMADVLTKLSIDCKWRREPRHPRNTGDGCYVYYPDLRNPPPPDLPPGLMRLQVVKGGKPEPTPAEQASVAGKRLKPRA